MDIGCAETNIWAGSLSWKSVLFPKMHIVQVTFVEGKRDSNDVSSRVSPTPAMHCKLAIS